MPTPGKKEKEPGGRDCQTESYGEDGVLSVALLEQTDSKTPPLSDYRGQDFAVATGVVNIAIEASEATVPPDGLPPTNEGQIEASEASYPTTQESLETPNDAERSTMLWLFGVVQKCLNPTTRGPLSAYPPTLGIYSNGFDHALHDAVKTNDVEKAQERLAQGADPNQYCSGLKIPCMTWAAMHNAFNVIPVLVAAGGDVSRGTILGMDPVAHCVAYGRPLCVKALIQCGANPNALVPVPKFFGFIGIHLFRCTPLHYAASYREHLPTVKALLEHKADARQKNIADLKPIHMCSMSPAGREIARFLANWERDHPSTTTEALE